MTDFDAAGGGSRVRFRCERPSAHAAWLCADGQLRPMRCGAPNKCAYCAYMAAVENTLVVGLDARRHGHPCVGMTLTTVDPQHDLAKFRRDVEKVFKALRRRWPWITYLGMAEWTTGKSARSGGHRRVHIHILIRGLVAEDAPAAEEIVKSVWLARTGAHRVEVRELHSAAGATAYIVAHHHKREQAPPPGFSGKRMRPSPSARDRPGYFVDGIASLRGEVRALEADKAVMKMARQLINWDYVQDLPDDAYALEWAAALDAARTERAMIVPVILDRDGGIIRVADRKRAQQPAPALDAAAGTPAPIRAALAS